MGLSATQAFITHWEATVPLWSMPCLRPALPGATLLRAVHLAKQTVDSEDGCLIAQHISQETFDLQVPSLSPTAAIACLEKSGFFHCVIQRPE